jgi:periplasmic protein TonB
MKLILIIVTFLSYHISFSQDIKREREIFDCVENQTNYDTPPTFKGDSTRMQKYIQKRLRYPSEAIRADIEGKVYIRFSVSKKGKIDSLDVLKSIGFGCDEEALRIVKTMQKWTPAKNKNIFVSSHYVVPVIFKLDKE